MPRPGQGHARLVGVAVELVAWWAVAVGVWMASLSAYSTQDFVVAVGCGVPCAAAAVAARRAVGGAWRPPARTLRWAVMVPARIVTDAVRVLSLPLRRGSSVGEFRRISLGAGRSGAAAGRRAVAALLLSSTPGAYVVDLEADGGTALVHAVGKPSGLEREVAQ